MAKIGFEDYKRHVNDRQTNDQKFSVLQVPEGENKAILKQKNSKDLKVGDIIVIQDKERAPADMMLIGCCPKAATERPPAFCHIETSNIDGESNMKVRQVPEVLNELDSPLFDMVGTKFDYRQRASTLEKMSCTTTRTFENHWKDFSFSLDVSKPCGDLDAWKGSQLQISYKGSEPVTLNCSMENMLVRGSVLMNTRYIFGVIVYTGYDCKVIKNSERSLLKGKSSSFESIMNNLIGLMGCVLVVISTILAICNFAWSSENAEAAWYLDLEVRPEYSLCKFFTWVIIFSQCVPISLLVSLETMRFLQSKVIEGDEKMKESYKVGQVTVRKSCTVQNSEMNEDLGRVQFVFSDKTGTLTENRLDFRQLLVAGNKSQGGGYTQIAWMNLVGRGGLEEVTEGPNVLQLMTTFKISVSEAKEYLRRGSGNFKNAFEICEQDNDFSEANQVSFNKTCRREVQDALAKSLKNRYWESLVPFDQTAGRLDPAEHPELMNEIYFRCLAFNNDVFPVYDPDLRETNFNADTPDDVCFAWFCKYIGLELVPYRKPYKDIEIELPGMERRYESWKELRLLKFTSAKKRMSVVMERSEIDRSTQKEDKVYIFVKGADNMIKKIADPESAAFYEKHMQDSLDTYCAEGLRTLLVGYAVYSKKWWEENWAPRFEQNLDEEALEALEIEFDKACKYHICGVTAVEDKLQDQVPETVSNLLGAGIRTWVVTGDKKETAINIGMACNLLTNDMKVYGKLYELEKHNYREQLDRADQYFDKDNVIGQKDVHVNVVSQKDSKHGLVITGDTVEAIFNDDKETQDKFIKFALNCHSVVACRLQPSQKARIVQAIKDSTGAITLAIGDGANDEAMIKIANVGVGISGLEGTAAARASDYVISKFRMLNNLLLNHGRNWYRSTTYMVFYLIYKNVIHMFNFFWFAFYSGFSGQTLYLEWVWQMWNTMFTAFPIFMYVLVDNDLAESVLLGCPNCYPLTNGNADKPTLHLLDPEERTEWNILGATIDFNLDAGSLFNYKLFFGWVLAALCQSAFAMHVLFQSFGDAASFQPDGKSWGFMEVSIVIMTSYVILINVTILLKYSHLTFWHNFFMFGTMLSFVMYMVVINSGAIGFLSTTAGHDWRGIILHLWGSSFFWLLVFLIVTITLAINQLPLLIQSLFFPSKLHRFLQYTTDNRYYFTCNPYDRTTDLKNLD